MARYAPMYEMSRPYVYESVWMANARREDCRRVRTVRGRGECVREDCEDVVIEVEKGVTELPVLVVSPESWRATGPQGERDERMEEIDRGSGAERVWTYEPRRTERDEASQSVERVCSRRGEWRIAGRVVKREEGEKREETEIAQSCRQDTGRVAEEEERGENGENGEEKRLPAAVIGAAERRGVLVCGMWSTRKRDAVEVAAFTVQYVIESRRGDVSVVVTPYLADRDEIAAVGSVAYETERTVRGGVTETTVVAHVYAMQDVPRGEWCWYIRHDVKVGEERAVLKLVTVSGSSFLRR